MNACRRPHHARTVTLSLLLSALANALRAGKLPVFDCVLKARCDFAVARRFFERPVAICPTRSNDAVFLAPPPRGPTGGPVRPASKRFACGPELA